MKRLFSTFIVLFLLFQAIPAEASLTYPVFRNDTFSGIELSNPLAKQFIKGEYYLLKGSVSKKSEQVVSLVVYNKTNQDFEIKRFPVINSDFEFFLHFDKAGSYLINIGPGNLQGNLTQEIRVIEREEQLITEDQKHSPPSNLRYYLEGNNSFLSWKNRGQDNLNKLVFKQGSRSVTVYTSNDSEYWEVDYSLFKDFSEGPVKWTIQSAYSNDTSLIARQSDWSRIEDEEIPFTKHHFAQISPKIEIENLDFREREGAILRLKGNSQIKLQNTVRLIDPNGSIIELELIKEDPNSLEFEISYRLRREGSYIVELLDQGNLPVLNIPIYVGKTFPAIPDFMDLEQSLNAQEEFDQNILASQMLAMINKERTDQGLSKLILDQKLENLASDYAREIIDSSNFSHTDTEGEKANIRKLEFGILTPIGENLAQANGIKEAHSLLMRSAAHRANILDPRWERVGIGIAKKENGVYVVVQEFSVRSLQSDPLSSSQIQNMEQDIINSINKERVRKGLSKLSENYYLSNVSKEALEQTGGDLVEGIKFITRSSALDKIRHRITSLSSSSSYTDLSKAFAEHKKIMSPYLKQIALAIYQDQDNDQLKTLVLLKR